MPAPKTQQHPDRPPLEVADIFRMHGEQYRNAKSISHEQSAVMRHIEQCRTETLGGHIDKCDTCGHTQTSYNSCRDRHCPKCQRLKKAEWLEAQMGRLLPVHYFHAVFTIPAQLNPLVICNRAKLYSILFKASAQTLQELAGDSKYIGGQAGFTSVLHTWGQKMLLHPHVHCIVTGGGYDNENDKWISTRENYFLPVKVMSRLFRGKFIDELTQAYENKELSLAGNCERLNKKKEFKKLKKLLWQKEWVVYCKRPFGGPEHVFEYLGRYTHRVAISNGRLTEMSDGKVTFGYKDYSDASKWKAMTIEADEFIRRFLLHVLPKRFTRIRHYGIMAPCNVKTKLERCRELLGAQSAKQNEEAERLKHLDKLREESVGNLPEGMTCEIAAAFGLVKVEVERKKTWRERLMELTGIDPCKCPVCGAGQMVRIATIEPEWRRAVQEELVTRQDSP